MHLGGREYAPACSLRDLKQGQEIGEGTGKGNGYRTAPDTMCQAFGNGKECKRGDKKWGKHYAPNDSSWDFRNEQWMENEGNWPTFLPREGKI